jgi:hypothetical protein
VLLCDAPVRVRLPTRRPTWRTLQNRQYLAASAMPNSVDGPVPASYRGRVTLQWEQVLVHSVDPVSLGQWWAEALGWVVVHASVDEFEIRPEPDRLPAPPWTTCSRD